ncbi:MAG TPA: phage holin family protein [Anaerolineales bacterium]|nr:phage holin family protein [Anaerolineales bacterium]
MYKFVLRWAINAVALYVAITLLDGAITLDNPGWQTYVWLGLIFGLINALLRPVITFLTCPLILLTLGLFTLVINTGMFYLAGYVGRFFGIGFEVNSLWSAFLASLIVSLVSIALSMFLRDDEKKRWKR